MSDVAKMDQVLAAVVKAMASVKTIGKGGRNEHDKYDFASIDDFLAALNPICAEAGLIFHMEELAREEFTRKGKYGESPWLLFTYSITTMHASGQCLPPVRRSVEVVRTGAQSYGSAQSYALKQFLRSLLLVPTGDKDDADFAEKGDGPVVRDNGPRRQDAPPAESAQAGPPYTERQARRELGECETLVDLKVKWGWLYANHREIASGLESYKDDLKDLLTNPPSGEAPREEAPPSGNPFGHDGRDAFGLPPVDSGRAA